VILDELSKEIDEILERITISQLSRYHTLQCTLQRTDVSKDQGYQCLFNGFYRMQRRKSDWYDYFFSLLEDEKKNTRVSFMKILRRIYHDRGRVEPSFSSKLVATIRPGLPVYDKYVRENLGLAVPRSTDDPVARVENYVKLYSRLSRELTSLTQHAKFAILRKGFDTKFGPFAGFTDMKKLDLLLWQYRDAKMSE
jgi:hypothetical protein